MLHDIDLVPLAADYTVAGQEYAEAQNLKRLDEDGQTSRVIMARMMTMRATIVATGTVSVFEALLRTTYQARTTGLAARATASERAHDRSRIPRTRIRRRSSLLPTVRESAGREVGGQ